MAKRKRQDEYVQTKQELLLGIHLEELKLDFVRQYKFCERLWRFDFALLDRRIAIEINGGNWTGGHRRGKDQDDENDKINRAQMEGWKVLQYTNEQVWDGRAQMFIKIWLGLDRCQSTTPVTR